MDPTIMDTVSVYLMGATILASGGIAFGAVRSALNGTKERVNKIEVNVAKHLDDHTKIIASIARIETKLDILVKDK